MRDLIDRMDVIDALIHKWDGMAKSVFDLIMDMPSAQPERKKGKWIDLRCNQCGQVDMSKPYFCPNCGADMRDES